jgi:hypothetical protein
VIRASRNDLSQQGRKRHKEEFSVTRLCGLCDLAVKFRSLRLTVVKLSTQTADGAHPILGYVPDRQLFDELKPFFLANVS